MARGRLIGIGALLATLAFGAPARAADLLPDLVSDPPANAYLETSDRGDGTQDLLLRFDGYVHNAGQGPLDVRGSRATTNDVMTPFQRVYDTSGGQRDDPMPGAELLYVDADGHHHWHLQSVARYSLWNGAKTNEVAPAMKVGFCLNDSERVGSQGPATGVYTDRNGRAFCKQQQPGALSLFEGVSAGWRDLYDSRLAFQWVVVSDVQPGSYRLREDIDTGGIVHESDESNAPAYAASATTIPGYLARAASAPPGKYGQPQQIALDADKFGSPGARRFRVVTPPGHGTLDVATGTDFSAATVTYTPAAGYSGPDSFTFVARDSASAFPLHPAAATMTLNVGAPAPSVAIDGAPATLETGHGVQLHATVANDVDGVVWSVDGVDGGSAAAGTITPDGFYTAPAAVPPAGSVTIAARTLSGAHDERTVTIVDTIPVPPSPAPDPPPNAPPPKPSSALGPIATGLSGQVIVARVTPRRAGVVSLAATLGKRRLGGCRARLAPRQRFSCRMRVPRRAKLTRLKVEARLSDGKGKLLARRTLVGRPRKLYG